MEGLIETSEFLRGCKDLSNHSVYVGISLEFNSIIPPSLPFE